MSGEPWPHQPWEYILHNIKCMSCGKPVEGDDISSFAAMVRSGVSKEEALNNIGYKRTCCRVTMTRPNILPVVDVIDREIVLGRKNIREADLKIYSAPPAENALTEAEREEMEAKALEMRALRRERALENMALSGFGEEMEMALERWEEDDRETRQAMLRQGLNPLQVEERLTSVFSLQSQAWETPALDKTGKVKRLAGIPTFQLGLGDGELEMRDVGLRYQVRVLKRRTFFAL